MNHLFTDAYALIQALGWTLLHSLWQGAIIAAGLWLVLKTIPNARPAIRYHLSLAALTLLMLWIVSTGMHQWQLMQAVQVRVTEGGADAGTARSYVISTLPRVTGTWHWLRPVLPALERSFPWLVGLYAVGLLLMCVRLAAGFTRLYQIRRTGLITPAPLWLHLLEELKERLEITARVRFFFSDQVQVPMVMGILKPLILLPAATLAQLSAAQLEAILLHELAHIRRNDYLINLLQTIVETILFFNPAVWQVSAAIRREREHCCDDLVLENAPEPLPYATALASLELARLATPVGALAAAGQPRHLFNRIKRIMEMKHNQSNWSRMVAAFLVITAITCSVIWLTPSFAQQRKKEKETAPRSEQRATPPPPPSYPAAPEAPETPPTPEQVDAITEQALRTAETALKHIDLDNISKTVDDAMKNVDWDQINRETEQAMKEARKELKDTRKTMRGEEWNRLSPKEQREVETALEEARLAMKAVDVDKIRREVDQAMKGVDWDKINAEIRQSLQEVERELNDPKTRKRIQKEAKRARAEALESAAEVREAVLKAAATHREKEVAHREREADRREAAAERRTEALEAARAQRDEDAAQRSAEAATRRGEVRVPQPPVPPHVMAHPHTVVAPNRVVQVRPGRVMAQSGSGRPVDYHTMLDRMEADGLIDQDRGYAIAHSNGRLKINNKEQSEDVRRKYRAFLDGKTIAISGSRNNLSIVVD